ncbi:MAG: hypothetical protein HC838_04405 [Spirulinaceae cyanobacterium RM2_2_10]|nr:hypothetical protein [Spirulinaceae cyanobacterium SM2_1_0]NJO19450.1 hypothetical protein [Spirulinaceae cyanobacterium RM2_2_10]
MNDNQHRRSAEQAFEEALAKLEALPALEATEAEAESVELPAHDLEEVWEEAGADLEAFFNQQQTDADAD